MSMFRRARLFAASTLVEDRMELSTEAAVTDRLLEPYRRLDNKHHFVQAVRSRKSLITQVPPLYSYAFLAFIAFMAFLGAAAAAFAAFLAILSTKD